VKKFGDLSGQIETAVGQYAADVRDRSFPTTDATYQPKPAAPKNTASSA
jgi:3-methyl-2-oxobutanoate hydroxymethyltransferase